jgi:ATP-dependent Lon protease
LSVPGCRIWASTQFSHRKLDLHIHIPEGAIPKDGPSAGIAMCTSLVSALTRRPVRRDVAMTGEITLRGRVLPIGGLKEKMLAAHRGGIRKVIIPRKTKKTSLKMVSVEHMDEVLPHALVMGPGETLFTEHDLHFEMTTERRDKHAPIN